MHPWRRIDSMKFAVSFAVASICLVRTGASQPSGSLVREGQFWVHTADGTFSAAAAHRLRITASGNVVLRGDSGDRVVYTTKRRMKARTEDEARLLLRGFEVKTTIRGDAMYLTVTS